MKFEYKTKGVCSQKMIFEIEDDAIHNLQVVGGCNGNGQGLSALVEGMKINDVINRTRGIACGFKSTSCPEQLASALEYAKQQLAKHANK